MSKQINRRLEMFRRVHDFGAMRQADFATGTEGHDLLTELGEVISQLVREHASQRTGLTQTRLNTTARMQARRDLMELLTHMQLAARVMTRKIPGLSARFTLSSKVGDEELLVIALNFVEEATPLEAEFLRHEMVPGFLQTLTARIAAFEKSGGQRNEAMSEQRQATQGALDTASRGMQIVRNLGTLVRIKYARNPLALSEWTVASRVGKGPAHAGAGEGGEGESTAPATT